MNNRGRRLWVPPVALSGLALSAGLLLPQAAGAQPAQAQVGVAFSQARDTGGQGPLLARPALLPVRPLPSWLSWSYQRGTNRRCVLIWNNTPRGDTGVRMCRGGLVETS